jgi:hypothetical protein
MKIFLFISYLWVMAFSQMIYASNENKEISAVQSSQSVSSEDRSEKLFCREDVSKPASFEAKSFVNHESSLCDEASYDHQIDISEQREQHEYNVLISAGPAEFNLVQMNVF